LKVREEVEEFLRRHEARGRVYVHGQGVNASLCVPAHYEALVRSYFTSLLSSPGEELLLSATPSHHPLAARLRVSNRKLVEGLGSGFHLAPRGRHVTGEQWNTALREEYPVILDVRNSYEWEVGRFRGASRPAATHFRSLPALVAEELGGRCRESTPVLMYCTGGIRCEVFSSILVSEGWRDVRQLEGGVLRYGEGEDTAEWEGNLFVFDDRMVVPIDGVLQLQPHHL